MALGLRQTLGRSLSIDDGADRPLVTYHYGDEAERSYFHPVAPPGAPPLTLCRPHDHPWHTGLFFAWKFVDGVNFWEPGHGRVVSRSLTITEHQAGRVTWSQQNDWIAAPIDAGPVLLREHRDLEVRLLDDRRYLIDWQSTFCSDGLHRLHADPARGYGGIGVRFIRDFQAKARLLAAAAQNDLPSIRGGPRRLGGPVRHIRRHA